VSGIAVGDRVAFFPAWGSWREQMVVDAGAVSVVPDEVSDDVAAQLFVNPVTAREVLRAVEQAGRGTAGVEGPLVITGAASSVGSFIVDGALARGLEVVPVVRSDSAAEVVRGHFPGLPVVTTFDDGWRDALRSAIAGRPVPVIVDAHGGPFARELMREFLSPEGTLLIYGDLTGGSTGVETFDFLIQEHGIRGVSIGRWLTRPAEVREGDVQAALTTAKTSPHLYAVADVHPFDEVADAVVASRKAGKRGTVLLADPS
jgi:NADPH:quinone reductase-like Zn-dependent oxidoreductase